MKLGMNSPSVRHLCKADKRLAMLISEVGEMEYHIHDDGYSFLVHEIIEQMLSVKVAATIFDRFAAKCDGAITPSAVQKLSIDDISSVGISKRKAKSIIELTNEMIRNEAFLEEINDCSVEDAITKLKSIYGIGTWTAKMYLIFVMDKQDILPFEDGAFRQTYKWLYRTNDISPQSISYRCQVWKPYSSIGARYMYRALDTGLTSQMIL